MSTFRRGSNGSHLAGQLPDQGLVDGRGEIRPRVEHGLAVTVKADAGHRPDAQGQIAKRLHFRFGKRSGTAVEPARGPPVTPERPVESEVAVQIHTVHAGVEFPVVIVVGQIFPPPRERKTLADDVVVAIRVHQRHDVDLRFPDPVRDKRLATVAIHKSLGKLQAREHAEGFARVHPAGEKDRGLILLLPRVVRNLQSPDVPFAESALANRKNATNVRVPALEVEDSLLDFLHTGPARRCRAAGVDLHDQRHLVAALAQFEELLSRNAGVHVLPGAGHKRTDAQLVQSRCVGGAVQVHTHAQTRALLLPLRPVSAKQKRQQQKQEQARDGQDAQAVAQFRPPVRF